MKRSFSIAFAFLTCFGITAMAQTSHSVPNAPGSGRSHEKIAVIMFQTAVARTNEGQRDMQNIDKKFRPREQKMKQENDQINSLKKQFQAQSKTLSATQRKEKANEIQSKEKELQQQVEDARSAFRKEWGPKYNALAHKVGAVMISYAKAHGYSVVLNANRGQGSPVLWASRTPNITKAVIAAYNKKSGVPAPPPSAPKPTGTHKAGTSGR